VRTNLSPIKSDNRLANLEGMCEEALEAAGQVPPKG
jgi:hypothetical protein